MLQHAKQVDMTQGGIFRQLMVYSIPILLSELFQQLYNTVDSVILGNFVSAQAMAAAGGTSSVTKMLVGFSAGVSIGCTVVVARYFGEKNEEKLRRSVSTMILLMAALGVLLATAGLLVTRPVLQVLSTPGDILPMAEDYLRIYFLGLPGLVLYNTFTGILRAVGDTRRPFYFLVLSSLLNVALDIVLAVQLDMGVSGAALATILSQALAAVLCLVILLRTQEAYRFRIQERLFDREIMRTVLRMGIPIGFQKTLTSFSNVIVLSYINFFGDACLAGWVVYTKVNHFVVVGLQSVGTSVTTFVSQNLGAGQYRRAQTGVRYAYWSSLLFAAAASLLILVFCRPIARLFGDDASTLSYAQLFLSHLIMLQMVHAAQSIYAGAMRGMGYAASSTVIMLTCLIGIRQLYLFCVTQIINTPVVVGLAFPLGWLAAGTVLYLFYRRYMGRALRQTGCAPDAHAETRR